MAEVLSQNEIDALLTAVSDGKVEANVTVTPDSQPDTKEKEYLPYNFISAERAAKGRWVAFNGIHERFANTFRMSLCQTLKKNVSVKVTHSEELKFGEFLSGLTRPVNLSIFECESLKANMVLVSRSDFTYSLVDAYYGGSDRPFSKMGEREAFTNIELEVIKKFAQVAIRDLEQAWSLNYPLKLKYQRAENHPYFVGVIQSTELVTVVNCEIEIEQLKGNIELVIQNHPLEPIQHALCVNVTGQIPGEEELWREHWLKELMEMEFEVRGILGETEKTLKQIRQLKVGDVVVLGQDAVSPICLTVQDVTKFRGLMGVFRGNNAVRLTKDLSKEQEESNDGK